MKTKIHSVTQTFAALALCAAMFPFTLSADTTMTTAAKTNAPAPAPAPAQATLKASPDIRVNQVGYYPKSRKVAVVVTNETNEKATRFSVVRVSDGKQVLSGNLSAPQTWEDAGETGRQADFSKLVTAGTYKIVLNDKAKSESHPFSVAADIYKDAANASMRTYYFQRCSYPLTQKFAGAKWERRAGHPDTAVSFHPSSGKTSGKLRSPGGWYDAGDFGKYIVNSGISVGTLLAFYDLFPTYFPDKSLNIPESGSGMPDILDEVKFNLDWMITMQDDDGGVFFKLTTLAFPGYKMPHADKDTRFVIGKSTTSALNFAAALAMAARVYAPFNKEYADDCRARAVRAWEWAVKNPNAAFKNPEDVKTGEYGDKGPFNDEFIWAAAELLITTGDRAYADFLRDKDMEYRSEPTWQNVHGLAILSLSLADSKLPIAVRDNVRASVVRQADKWMEEMGKSLYRVPNITFNWGSNSGAANMGICMLYAHRITGDRKYLTAAAEIADYLLGKNAVGMSFMTGFGSYYAANPHHRQVVAAAKIENMKPEEQAKRRVIQPSDDVVIRGFLVGGPNSGQQDKQHGVEYRYTLPAKSYEDVYKSYASNEVAINWNAPLTFLLGGVDLLMGDGSKR